MNSPDNHHLAIVFDFGGVLLDWSPHYLYRKLFDGDDQAIDRFLEHIHFESWNREQDAGRPFAVAVEVLCQQYPEYCDLIRAYDERWVESLGGPIQPSVEVLRDLKDAGYTLHALSNWSVEKYNLVRGRYDFLNWFETVIISGEVRLVKPDLRIYQLLLDKIQRLPGECLVIDDSPANIAAARQLGFKTIHFQSGEQLRGELLEWGFRFGAESVSQQKTSSQTPAPGLSSGLAR
ncbi:MAG: HAD family phosphatase [Chloroflexota bacterium]